MKNPICMILMLCSLAGCSGDHRFEVDVGETQPEKAELMLYGRTTPMKRSGKILTAARSNQADGSGRITIFYPDGQKVICPIGYVTSGETEPHRFRIEDRQCHGV